MRAVPKSEVYSLDGGRTLVMHPEIARKLEQLMARQMDTLTADIIMGRPR